MRTQGQPPPNCGCSYGDLDIKVSMLFISFYVSYYLDIKRQVGAGIVNRALSFPLKLIAKNAGIASVAIIDRQLTFEYTIASRSTDVMVLVLRVEKKLSVIEQPISPAPAAGSTYQEFVDWNAIYDAHNEVACLMLGSMTPELHRQFENSSPYEMLQELKSMFEKQARVKRNDRLLGCPYVIKMKGYVEQLEHLGYVLLQDLSVGLIMNGLISDFAGFVRNYNMHNMGKTIGELHALLIEYDKGLPKKAATPQAGKGKGKGNDKPIYIPKPKNLKPSTKEHPTKDDACHHYKEVGHCKRNCPAYLAELIKKKKQVGTASSSSIFTIELFSFSNKSWVYDTGC
ncbi:putative reverse transcriptase domain-containing protein, partial [Tanacetum coccineum]